MDLKSGEPFWRIKNGPPVPRPRLGESTEADLCIVGAGITGALIAHAAIQEGWSCALLDRREAGCGSTVASTALLQYEIDTPLVDLAEKIGEPAALQAYRACEASIDRAEAICRDLNRGDFSRRDSVCFASSEGDLPALRHEFEFRRRHGFDVEWLSPGEIGRRWDWRAPGAILSRAAQMDAYQMTQALLDEVVRAGSRVFTRTAVTAIEEQGSRCRVMTAEGPTVSCRHAVVAAGYECLDLLKSAPEIDLNSTYALVSLPLTTDAGWPDGCLLWETARPYIYARRTSDGRGILGGADAPFRDAASRDRLLPSKTKELASRWNELFPRIPLEVATAWTGTFAETKDGLPYLGFPRDQPRTFFALCYGGNGIMSSLIAGEMLVAALRGDSHPCAPIFRFDR